MARSDGEDRDMAEDAYNGWTNRETWAVNLLLGNDQGTYRGTLERVRRGRDDQAAGDAYAPWRAGEEIKAYLEELLDPEEGLLSLQDVISWLRDIGSLYRVDWREIGQHWLEDVNEAWPVDKQAAE